jgi:hypothetical protein
MKPTPFNPEQDLAPTPFDKRHKEIAAALKAAGLPWQPHVGCFVWDRDHHIEVSSPFPGRVYFILNLGHFLKRFETVEEIADKLIWLPTWNQTRLLCERYGIRYTFFEESVSGNDELIELYKLLLNELKLRSDSSVTV